MNDAFVVLKVALTVTKIDLTPPPAAAELRTDSGVQRKNLSHLNGRELASIDSTWLAADTDALFPSNENNLGDQFILKLNGFIAADSFNLFNRQLGSV